MAATGVVLLTGDGPAGRIAAHYLMARFPDLTVVVEQPVSRATLLRRRLRRLGWKVVAGQLLFMLVQRFQERLARGRLGEIRREFGLDEGEMPPARVRRVSSVNDAETVALLKALSPAVILVVGTRLIAREVLAAVSAPFINYHAGMTPKYRGVHGGYWARATGDADNCGVTVHLIDEGIDTGAVLYQARIAPGSRDNFSTYPLLQTAAALPLLEEAARDALAGKLVTRAGVLPSRLWSHPTLWGFVATGFRKRVW